MHKQTRDNLVTAMSGEAFAFAKYTLFAKRARESGNEQLAELFEDTAHTEFFEHFAEEAQLAELVGSNVDNLRAAISGETFEAKKMYKEFAEKAAQAGDAEAAARFNEIRSDEAKHRAAFRSILEKIDNPPIAT